MTLTDKTNDELVEHVNGTVNERSELEIILADRLRQAMAEIDRLDTEFLAGTRAEVR